MVDDPKDTEPKTPLDIEKAKIAAEADIATNLAKLVSTNLPADRLPKGSIAVAGDAAPIEGLFLAYKAIDTIAFKIRERVQDHGAKRILLYNAADFKTLDALRVFRIQVGLLGDGMQSLVDQAETATGKSKKVPADLDFVGEAQHNLLGALPIIGAAITSAIQLVSLFQSDKSIKYSAVTVEYQTLATAVAHAFLKTRPPIEFLDTNIMPRVTYTAASESELLQTLKKLRELYDKLVGYRDVIADKIKTKADKALTALNAKIIATLAEMDAFNTALAKTDDASGTSRVMQLLYAEELSSLIDDDTFFLWVHPVAAGGGVQTEQHFARSDLSFSGGAIVSYALYDRNGKLVDAEVLRHYPGFVMLDNDELLQKLNER